MVKNREMKEGKFRSTPRLINFVCLWSKKNRLYQILRAQTFIIKCKETKIKIGHCISLLHLDIASISTHTHISIYEKYDYTKKRSLENRTCLPRGMKCILIKQIRQVYAIRVGWREQCSSIARQQQEPQGSNWQQRQCTHSQSTYVCLTKIERHGQKKTTNTKFRATRHLLVALIEENQGQTHSIFRHNSRMNSTVLK